jgi:chromosome segregation ATPase
LIVGVLKSKLERVKQQILLEKQLRTELDLENTTFKGNDITSSIEHIVNRFIAMVDELEVKNKEYEKQIEELAKQKPVENGTAHTPAPTNAAENSELAEQLKEMQQLYDSESRRVQKLEEQNQSLQNEVIDLQENQLNNLNVDNLQLKDQLTTAENKARELTEKYEETNRIMEQLVANTEALEKDNKHLQKQNQSLTRQLHESVSNIEKFFEMLF